MLKKLEAIARKFIEERFIPLPIIQSIPPNLVTLLAFFAGCSALPLLYFGFTYSAAASYIFSHFLDSLDGSIARYQRSNSPVGTLHDTISGRIIVASVIIGIVLISLEERAIWGIVILSLIFINYTMKQIYTSFKPERASSGYLKSPSLFNGKIIAPFLVLIILFPNHFDKLSISLLVVGAVLTPLMYLKAVKELSK